MELGKVLGVFILAAVASIILTWIATNRYKKELEEEGKDVHPWSVRLAFILSALFTTVVIGGLVNVVWLGIYLLIS